MSGPHENTESREEKKTQRQRYLDCLANTSLSLSQFVEYCGVRRSERWFLLTSARLLRAHHMFCFI